MAVCLLATAGPLLNIDLAKAALLPATTNNNRRKPGGIITVTIPLAGGCW